MNLKPGRHFDLSSDLSLWAIARCLPGTLRRAITLGWRTDRPCP
ncbi:hypothetical protein [Streptomyces sulphureus]|nr:hypothetical protein [Streptomyces sulphureus]